MNTSKHIVVCDGETVRTSDTLQECVAYAVRLQIEAQDVGLKLDCKVEEEKNDK